MQEQFDFFQDEDDRLTTEEAFRKLGIDIPTDSEVNFKYSEDEILREIIKHCEKTYSEHYANAIEAAEFIFEKNLDVGFFIDSALTYLARYGKKEGHNEKDLHKAIHFIVIAIHYSRILKERGLISE